MTKKKLRGIHTELARYTCNDFTEYPQLITKLQAALESKPDSLVDDIDDIVMWEKVEFRFTVKEFCETIGL